MILLYALLVAASGDSVPMRNWAVCTGAYVMPRLQAQATEVLVDHAMAACRREERAALKEWTDQYGVAQGTEIFRGVRVKVRQILVRRTAEAKKMRGYR